MTGGDPGLLRDMLKLYDFRQAQETRVLIDAVSKIDSKRSTARLRDGSIVNGVDITVTFDDTIVDAGQAFLFGQILSRFFGLYASINTYSRLTVKLSGISPADCPLRAAHRRRGAPVSAPATRRSPSGSTTRRSFSIRILQGASRTHCPTSAPENLKAGDISNPTNLMAPTIFSKDASRAGEDRISANHMGMLGPVAALPASYTHAAILERKRRSHSLFNFLELFAAELRSLFVDAHRKYRLPSLFQLYRSGVRQQDQRQHLCADGFCHRAGARPADGGQGDSALLCRLFRRPAPHGDVP